MEKCSLADSLMGLSTYVTMSQLNMLFSRGKYHLAVFERLMMKGTRVIKFKAQKKSVISISGLSVFINGFFLNLQNSK